MTDRPTTNEDLQMTLESIEESLAKAVDPAALVDGVSAHLGTLYTSAETAQDNDAMLAIEQTWNNVQSLARSAATNREAYLTAKDIAGTFQTQRDEALNELKELSHAVDHMDTDHPAVADLVESVQEAISETEMLWWDDTLSDSVYEHLQEAFGYDVNEKLSVFMDVFWQNIELTPARQREFFAWLDAVQADQELDEEGDDDDE